MPKSPQPDVGRSATIAGAAVSLALMDALIADGILSKDRALEVLAEAQRRVSASTTDPNVKQAAIIISGLHQRLMMKS